MKCANCNNDIEFEKGYFTKRCSNCDSLNSLYLKVDNNGNKKFLVKSIEED